ncbi:MAG: hypothetical protein E7G47_10850 [Clostridium perfringens]|nr:hypothetical protein [Clostridium perfringens]
MGKVNEIDNKIETENNLLILRAKDAFSNEELEKAEEKLSKKIGRKVVIIPNIFDIVSKNYNKKHCVIVAKIDTDSIVKHINETIKNINKEYTKGKSKC